MKERVLKCGVRALLLGCCALGLTSCSAVGGLLSYLINLPVNLLKAVIP